jgi:hypothetical protein
MGLEIHSNDCILSGSTARRIKILNKGDLTKKIS